MLQTEIKNTGDSCDIPASDRWFITAITVYVIIEAACIAVLMYQWLSN